MGEAEGPLHILLDEDHDALLAVDATDHANDGPASERTMRMSAVIQIMEDPPGAASRPGPRRWELRPALTGRKDARPRPSRPARDLDGVGGCRHPRADLRPPPPAAAPGVLGLLRLPRVSARQLHRAGSPRSP